MAEVMLPLLYGVATLIVLEIGRLLLRRFLPGFRLRLVYHVWAVLAALAAVLVAAHFDRETIWWRIVAAVTIVFTAWIAYGLINAAVIKRPWRPQAPYLPKLARDVLRLGVLIAAALVAAKVFLDAKLGTLLVSSTVLSAVAGLALQDLLKNMFAGMALDLERSFHRGDWLLLDGERPAQVIDMSWRATRLRTNTGVEIYEPNSRISNARLHNYGSGAAPIGLEFRVGLDYAAPPVEAKAALRAAVEDVPEALAAPEARVYLDEFGDHAIFYTVRVWTLATTHMARFRDAVNTRIWYHLKRSGLGIPFPVRTVHLHDAADIDSQSRAAAVERSTRRLSELTLFRGLDPEAVRTLAAGAALRHYDDGEVLVREGEQGESLMVIDAGAVLVSKASPGDDGAEVDIGRLDAGDFFGEQSLLTGAPRNATVRAEDGCVVLEIDKPQLAELLAEDPRIAETLSHALAERQERTAASLASHEERLRSAAAPPSAASILARVRGFFGLR